MSLKPLEDCTLTDILSLFGIKEVNEQELKLAKRKVLVLHPDKNIGRDTSQYYEYFRKAYYKLEEIHKFLNTDKKQTTHYDNNVETETQKAFHKYYLEKGLDKDPKQFTKLFNEAFDNVYIKEDKGYGDWLKTNEGIYDQNDIEKSRKNAMQIIKKTEDIQCFSELDNYSDLKDAHINSVITIDAESVYQKKEKFNSIEEYQRFRAKDTRNLNLMEKKDEHERILSQQQSDEKMNSMNMAYDFMKQTEKAQSKFNEYVSKFLKIKNV